MTKYYIPFKFQLSTFIPFLVFFILVRKTIFCWKTSFLNWSPNTNWALNCFETFIECSSGLVLRTVQVSALYLCIISYFLDFRAKNPFLRENAFLKWLPANNRVPDFSELLIQCSSVQVLHTVQVSALYLNSTPCYYKYNFPIQNHRRTSRSKWLF